MTTAAAPELVYAGPENLAALDAIAAQRLGHNETATAVWQSMRQLLEDGPYAEAFNANVPVTPLMRLPREALPADLRACRQDVWLKRDDLMPGGAYKLQGATNRLQSKLLKGAVSEAVVFTTGNHGIESAIAAARQGIGCTAYVPEFASAVKIFAMKQAGARVVFGPDLNACGEMAKAYIKHNKTSILIHPYDQISVIAGQGNSTLRTQQQLLEAGVDLAKVTEVAPGGGGGNSSGKAVAAKVVYPESAQFVVAQSATAAGIIALREGRPFDMATFDSTIDGAAVPRPGRKPAKILCDKYLVNEVNAVSHGATGEAMAILALNLDIVVEPAGALAVAETFRRMLANPDEDRTYVVHCSGGNVTTEKVAEMAGHALAEDKLLLKEATAYISQAHLLRRLHGLDETWARSTSRQPGRSQIISSPSWTSGRVWPVPRPVPPRSQPATQR